jgi:hypothetical protein
MGTSHNTTFSSLKVQFFFSEHEINQWISHENMIFVIL